MVIFSRNIFHYPCRYASIVLSGLKCLIKNQNCSTNIETYYTFALHLIGINKLDKYKRKNIGNARLIKAIDVLINQIDKAEWQKRTDLIKSRPDSECVHSDGFFFLNLVNHRILILFLFEENIAAVIWIGSHDDYEITFRNNKSTVARWLRNQQLI